MAGTVWAVAAHFTADVDPLGDGHLAVNGDDITHLIAGFDLSVRPGQPTTLTIHLLGSATIEGTATIHTTQPVTAAEAQAEVAAALEALADTADALWAAAVMRPEAAGPGGPARALLLEAADQLTGAVQ